VRTERFEQRRSYFAVALEPTGPMNEKQSAYSEVDSGLLSQVRSGGRIKVTDGVVLQPHPSDIEECGQRSLGTPITY
jgi:hypothetical protein